MVLCSIMHIWKVVLFFFLEPVESMSLLLRYPCLPHNNWYKAKMIARALPVWINNNIFGRKVAREAKRVGGSKSSNPTMQNKRRRNEVSVTSQYRKRRAAKAKEEKKTRNLRIGRVSVLGAHEYWRDQNLQKANATEMDTAVRIVVFTAIVLAAQVSWWTLATEKESGF